VAELVIAVFMRSESLSPESFSDRLPGIIASMRSENFSPESFPGTSLGTAVLAAEMNEKEKSMQVTSCLIMRVSLCVIFSL